MENTTLKNSTNGILNIDLFENQKNFQSNKQYNKSELEKLARIVKIVKGIEISIHANWGNHPNYTKGW